jgi:hypothetical protein
MNSERRRGLSAYPKNEHTEWNPRSRIEIMKCRNCNTDNVLAGHLCWRCGIDLALGTARVAESSSCPLTGSPSLVGSEFLIARWEAKLEELEELASEQRGTYLGLMAQTQEKARAYRACIADLRRHAGAQSETPKP